MGGTSGGKGRPSEGKGTPVGGKNQENKKRIFYFCATLSAKTSTWSPRWRFRAALPRYEPTRTPTWGPLRMILPHMCVLECMTLLG